MNTTSVLTLTANLASEIGVSAGTANSAREAATLLKIDEPTVEVSRFIEAQQRRRAESARAFQRQWDQVASYFFAIGKHLEEARRARRNNDPRLVNRVKDRKLNPAISAIRSAARNIERMEQNRDFRLSLHPAVHCRITAVLAGCERLARLASDLNDSAKLGEAESIYREAARNWQRCGTP